MAHLSVRLLGAFQVTLDDHPIAAFESDKVRALLAYLIVEAGRPHRRSALAGLLWPDSPEQMARHNLSQALFSLRQTIGDRSANPPFLLISRDTLQFNPHSNYDLDVAAFTSACSALNQSGSHSNPSTLAVLDQAVQLYRGGFMQQFSLSDSDTFEEWLLLKRESLHMLALRAMGALADSYEQSGNYEQARHYAWRQLELDPWREEAHRQLMRVFAASGQRSAALVQYERCRTILQVELGVEPSEETSALYERIRSTQELTQSAPPSSPSATSRLPFTPPAPLPIPPTPFIGREMERSELARYLADQACRMITLVGPGGIGKTRLALQTAADQRTAFTHGVAFVPLVAVTSRDFIVTAIAEALGITVNRAEDPQALLLDYLRDKDLLLTLDNAEHLLDAADLFATLLQEAPRIKLLVTSRERLHVRWEWVIELHGLTIPDDERVEELESYSAVALFVQSAQRVRNDFRLSVAERAAVVDICRLVDGMPLGIELAASWLRVLSSTEIVHEISRNLDFLESSFRDLPERHRSLRAVFEHSWTLLNAGERRVLSRLSVFRGGFGREAAAVVSEAGLGMLAALVEKSLLRRTAMGRYDIHELVRQYTAAKLQEMGETEQTRQRHLAFFLELAETTAPKLIQAEQITWLNQLELENDNLRMALQWALDRNDLEAAARLCAALWRFWYMRGYLSEGRRWIGAVLVQPERLSPMLQAVVCNGAGVLAFTQMDLDEALRLHNISVRLYRQLGDERGIATALNNLGRIASLTNDVAGGEQCFHESLELMRKQDNRWGIGLVLFNLALAAQLRHDGAQMRRYYAESLEMARSIGDRRLMAMVLKELGLLALGQGDTAQANALCREALTLSSDLGDREVSAWSMGYLAMVAVSRWQGARAAQILGSVAALREVMGAPIPNTHRDYYEYAEAAARAQLGEAAFKAAYTRGWALPLDQAIAYALGE